MITTLHGDCTELLPTLAPGSVQTIVTSPPYFGLRRYSDDPREIGNEPTPAEYVDHLVAVFTEAWRWRPSDWQALWCEYIGRIQDCEGVAVEAFDMNGGGKGLKAPFPYFGGKSRIASLVWERFGRVQNYVEPFFGSGAVLLGCPWPGHPETVNDADGLLANFWRALRADPDAVFAHADYPVSELDLHARHRWLVAQRADVERLLAEPDWYDVKIAGWWVWGISQWIGSGWCQPEKAHGRTKDGELWQQIPCLSEGGRGVFRDARALTRKRPHVGNAGMGLHRASEAHTLRDYLRSLAARLRRTRVVCGDFARVLGPSVTWRRGTTAVFLDPPYDVAQRAKVYAVESDAAPRARAWAIANGDNPLLRIALCGYDGEHIMPDGWVAVPWKAHGGYGLQGTGRGRENAARECVWFSPHCLDFDALPMFAAIQESTP